MKIDIIVAEIGSTTTVINGFAGMRTANPSFIGQGQSATTVSSGDVNIGLNNALENLRKNIGADTIEWDEFYASSSAAGGLRMTVHGLVYDMTVKAAREAALGAGAIIKYVTAGRMRDSDLKKVSDINPNLILLAGGVDYGERETALYNAKLLAGLKLSSPVIYGGNIENAEEIKSIFQSSGQKVYIVDNVYPRIDELNIEPTRKIIQKAFEEHITNAPGMKRVREIINGPIIPTPGAVMEAAMSLYEDIGDLVVFDVGGATTDVHSVTRGSEEIQKILISPEPVAKRTVEGDLGVFVNLPNIVERIGNDKLVSEFGPAAKDFINSPKPIPETETEKRIVERLTSEAVETSLSRHAGRIRYLYGPSGKVTIAEGKDLSRVKWVIGTGGALTRLPNRVEILSRLLLCGKESDLYPRKEASILIDNYYIMASLGVMSKKYSAQANYLMKKSMGLVGSEVIDKSKN